MTINHTPGPWRYETGTQTVRSVPANYWLGSLDSWDGAVKEQNDANGRLMAAAPELLAALKLMQAALTEYGLRDVKKRYSLCVADAAASNAIAAAEAAGMTS